MRVGGADPVYLAGDPHGTMQVVYTPSMGTVTRRAQDPYGNPLGPVTTTTSAGTTTPGTWPDNHGFLGKSESAATGLTDVGARAYDPTTGRCISVDPLLTLSEPQAVNGYTYAAGNPTLKSDPTGLEPMVRPADGSYCDVKCRNDGYGASPGDGAKWTSPPKSNEDTRNKWVAQHSPPTNDRTTLEADLQSVLENRSDDWWQPHYRQEKNGEWINYCFGQSGCEEALKYLRQSGDVQGAKYIAATYCVFNSDSCKRKAVISAAGETLLAAAAGLFMGGAGVAEAAGAAAACRTAPEVIRFGELKIPAVPKGVVGEITRTGKGVEYAILKGTSELDPRVAKIRVMDPVVTGKYQYSNGYVVYMNEAGQTVNPLTGRVVSRTDPAAHIPLP